MTGRGCRAVSDNVTSSTFFFRWLGSNKKKLIYIYNLFVLRTFHKQSHIHFKVDMMFWKQTAGEVASESVNQVGTDLTGVIVKNTDRRQLRSDTAALSKSSSAVLVRSLSELVCNRDVFHRRRSSPNHDFRKKSGVKNEAHQSWDETDDQNKNQQ